jgi:hypothetical protein
MLRHVPELGHITEFSSVKCSTAFLIDRTYHVRAPLDTISTIDIGELGSARAKVKAPL